MYSSLFARSLLLTPIGIAMLTIGHAQVMESNSYQIQSDSVNFGGARATSGSYVLEDTLGESATGRSSSDNYLMRAGFQQTAEPYLAIVPAEDVVLTPSLSGIIAGTSTGTTSVTVTTDSLGGYQMSVQAASAPAMQGEETAEVIADYTPAGVDPDFAFFVADGDEELGFTPEGADITQRFQDDGNDCNAGTSDATARCWDPLTTSDVTIAQAAGSNHPDGVETTLRFQVGIGNGANTVPDTYVATSTITVVAL